ncbi:OLC1v1010207C1 [Oldenlandia corymbosa var. corymbosa]|nr:OLC1v1010207C1 [Oldenlandia corymbosa var. corymbosa]
MGYCTSNFALMSEDIAVREAACSGLENVEKFIKLFSDKKQELGTQLSLSEQQDAADAAVNKFRKVISLLGRTRTGHARFRRGPLVSNSSSYSSSSTLTTTNATAQIPVKDGSNDVLDDKIYCPTPIQQIPPVDHFHHLINHHHNSISHQSDVPLTGVVVDRKEPMSRSISFSYSPAISHANSFISSLTGETDQSKQPTSSSPGFQVTNISQVSSAGKPPLSSSSSFKRKCMSENGVSGKCSASSGRCHCSKKRKLRLKKVIRVPAISMKISDIPPDDYSWRKYGQKPIKGSPHPR